MTQLFISDLHLHESRPAVTQAFYRFLREDAVGAEALYILGDFFDSWIGDDNGDPLSIETAAQLKILSNTGTKIFLMHGNRDFLLGEQFAQSAGATLIPDPTVIDLFGEPTLVMHGDTLCTRDTDYLAFRKQVRSPAWQQQALSQPLPVRRVIAAQIREKSASMNSLKAEDIMDVTEEEVIRVMQEAGVKRLIHGHTHRPARHSLTVDGKPAERIVLGDWHDSAWRLTATNQTIELIEWPINS